ncbi:MAG TPA: hypothetical protein VGT78_06170 [Rhizomicrobium sp.]|nr:hypothetical protein [Rhizomicrobium sp.]
MPVDVTLLGLGFAVSFANLAYTCASDGDARTLVVRPLTLFVETDWDFNVS